MKTNNSTAIAWVTAALAGDTRTCAAIAQEEAIASQAAANRQFPQDVGPAETTVFATRLGSRQCYMCPGTVEDSAIAGRTVSYRGTICVIPADLPIPTCRECGRQWVAGDLVDTLSVCLEAQLPRSS